VIGCDVWMVPAFHVPWGPLTNHPLQLERQYLTENVCPVEVSEKMLAPIFRSCAGMIEGFIFSEGL